jgi:hypothetical protein
MDSVFIERLCRYEDINLKGYADGHEGRAGTPGPAVDMMDNARALPRCPQPQQQTQQLCAA